MDCYHLDWDRIDRITDTALFYRDDRGDLLDIDLKKCRARYIKHVNTHLEAYPARNGVPVKDDENFRFVADRFFNGVDYAYFEFYGWPHIRFEKAIINVWRRRILRRSGTDLTQKYHDEFRSIQMQLEQAGWSTCDLS